MTPKERLTQEIFNVLKKLRSKRLRDIARAMNNYDYQRISQRLLSLTRNGILKRKYNKKTNCYFYSRVKGW